MVAANGLYQSVRNYETGARVVQTLLGYDEARFRRLKAVAFCGIVELSGEVASYFDKLLALGITEKVDGVTTVVESIRIQSINQPRKLSVHQHSGQVRVPRYSSETDTPLRFDSPHELS